MARIRTIKPGFFLNEDLAALPAITRLFFIGLWSQVDREGRCEDRPKRLKASLFPYEDVDIEEMILELVANKHLVRYSVGGVKILSVNNFLKHQRPHHKEDASILPQIPADFKHESSMSQSRVKHESCKAVLVPQEGKGREQEGNRKELAPAAHEPKIIKPKTPNQRVVEAYKLSKNVPMDDKAWDKANFGRYSKAAANLLACFGQDVEKCAAYIFLRAEDLNEKNLDWTLETITRHAFDGIGLPKKEEQDEQQPVSLGADRIPDTGRNRRITSSRSLAGDALRSLEHSAVRPDGPSDMDGPAPDQSRDGEDFS